VPVPKCPTCSLPLGVTRCEGVVIHLCPEGHGALVEDEALDQIKRGRRRQWDKSVTPAIRAEARAADTLATIRCPRCIVGTMTKREVQAEGIAFHLDRCEACHVIWVDRGELELIQMQYRKDMDNRSPEDLARTERKALAMFQLQQQMDREDEDAQNLGRSIYGAALNGPFVGAALLAARATRACLENGLEETRTGPRVFWIVIASICFAIAAGLVWVAYELRQFW
jgi:Zn-finger nucleic acid-binding protein